MALCFSSLCICVPMFGTAPFVITQLIIVVFFFDISWLILTNWMRPRGWQVALRPSHTITHNRLSSVGLWVWNISSFQQVFVLRTNRPSIYGLSIYFIYFYYWHFTSSWNRTEFSYCKWTPPMFLTVCFSQEITTSTSFWICVLSGKVRLG